MILLLLWIAPVFDRLFERFTNSYARLLAFCLKHRWVVVGLLVVSLIPAALAYRGIGQELFPEVDAGEFTVHMRVAGGPRVEETERQVAAIERIIRGSPEANVPGVVPPEDLEMILSNIGLSSRWSAIYSPNNGPHSAAIRVQLRSGFAGRKASTLEYVDRLRKRLEEEFPSTDFFFETGGMIRRVLNCRRRGADRGSSPRPQQRGPSRFRPPAQLAPLPRAEHPGHLPAARNGTAATHHSGRSQPGRPAVRLHRAGRDAQRLHRTDVQRQIAPNLWIDRSSGNHYLIGVQYPEDEVRSISSLEDIPISSDRNRPGTGNVRKLKEMARIERTQGPLEIFRHTGEPVSQLYLNVAGNDLRVAESIVRQQTGEMLLEYALANLPAAQRGLADDPVFKDRLETYLRDGHKNDRGSDHQEVLPSIRRLSSAACASRFAARLLA